MNWAECKFLSIIIIKNLLLWNLDFWSCILAGISVSLTVLTFMLRILWLEKFSFRGYIYHLILKREEIECDGIQHEKAWLYLATSNHYKGCCRNFEKYLLRVLSSGGQTLNKANYRKVLLEQHGSLRKSNRSRDTEKSGRSFFWCWRQSREARGAWCATFKI